MSNQTGFILFELEERVEAAFLDCSCFIRGVFLMSWRLDVFDHNVF